MYVRFSIRARKVLVVAHQEALQFHHEYVGTEHILLGLLAEGSGVACAALTSFGVNLAEARRRVEAIMPRGETNPEAKLPQTPRAKHAILNAMNESRAMGRDSVDAEQLLLGLLRQEDCVAAQVLGDFHVTVGELRREVLQMLSRLGREEDYAIEIVHGHDGITKSVSAAKMRVERSGKSESSSLQTPTGSPFMSPGSRTAILRILDASANRAAEGLRVVEDYLRFVLDDPLLTDEVKTLRHDLAAAVSQLDRGDLIAARDIRGDVGVDIKTEAETQRGEPLAVLSANLHRAAQALRSLGEYSKIIAPQVAPRFETIRYHVYLLESTLAAGQAGAARLAGVRLYVLVDGRSSRDEFIALVDSLLAAGVHAIQLRDKNLSDRELVDRGRALRERIGRFGASTLFIMNDRADLAALCDADGVHVGQDELAVADARKIVGPRRLVGVSTHSIEQARNAVLDGAHYIGVGPTFPSTTKAFTEYPGVALLADVASTIRLPALAIGGITLDNVGQVLDAGIRRVAVSAAIVDAADPAAETRKWLERLRDADESGA